MLIYINETYISVCLIYNVAISIDIQRYAYTKGRIFKAHKTADNGKCDAGEYNFLLLKPMQ